MAVVDHILAVVAGWEEEVDYILLVQAEVVGSIDHHQFRHLKPEQHPIHPFASEVGLEEAGHSILEGVGAPMEERVVCFPIATVEQLQLHPWQRLDCSPVLVSSPNLPEDCV